MKKFVVVAGARPNFVKVAPLLKAFASRRAAGEALDVRFVNTGQHYDHGLSGALFQDLDLPTPDYSLEVGSGSHAGQTAQIMLKFEPVCLAEKPDMVIVVGDVTSTLACALVAAKLNIAVAHVEAGLRSRDRLMPEEINRILTDHISNLLFTPSADADDNLRREGVPADKIFFVGNIMVDTLLAKREQARAASVRGRLGLGDRPYAVVTLHRPVNVDDEAVLGSLLETLSALPLPVVFPVHPRTMERLKRKGAQIAPAHQNLHVIEPLGYLSFVDLLDHAALVLTDSGGIQEETTVLGVPCLTLRDSTERPITVTQGTSTLVGIDRDRIAALSQEILDRGGKRGAIPPLWDGRTADRIVDVLVAQP